MDLSEQNFNDLLSDDDIRVDEDFVDDEIREDDPLGLSEFKQSASNEETISDEEETEESKENEKESSNFIEEYLKEFGIDDITKIKMQDEDGEIKDVDFNSLSEEDN
jgi:hypothetical protein